METGSLFELAVKSTLSRFEGVEEWPCAVGSRRGALRIAPRIPYRSRWGSSLIRVLPVVDDLAHIDIPALVVVGEEDAAFRRAADVMAARLPRARTLRIPGAGHIVNIEAEAAFNDAAKGFLASLGAP